jgi:hypothetical protein
LKGKKSRAGSAIIFFTSMESLQVMELKHSKVEVGTVKYNRARSVEN